jgi:Zn-dependent protease
MGDPTARAMGRLTLNPIKHMDIIGTLMILFIGFGWAKPVPINPNNFRNPKAGMAISALAGPVSNILMAVIGLILFRITLLIAINSGLITFVSVNPAVRSALTFFELFATLNVWFAVFNMIPIPPLDGSRIVSYFLSPRMHYYYNYVERYGFLILILMLNMNRFGFRGFNLISVLHAVSRLILSGIDLVLNPVFALFGG